MERVITAVIPAFSEINIVRSAVVSLTTQWIPNNEFKLEVIIVNDNPNMDYSYFLSDAFKPMVGENVEIVLINNKGNYGQGTSRQIGIDNATSNWVLLCDDDDMYAPNAVYRFWEILNEQHCSGDDGKSVALIAAPLYSFDKNKERKIIEAQNIWPNAKLYNRQFLRENEIRFPDGKNSHRSEDYPFVKKLIYAISNSGCYKVISFDDTADTFYYWMPNRKSRSRSERFYNALLTPFTTYSTCMIYDYYKWYNKRFGIEKDKDEFMKKEILNMNVYAYFNYLSWMFQMSQGWKDDEKFLEEDWELYKSSLKKLKQELKVYWGEIIPSDIFSMQTKVKENSDIIFVESWIGSFESWIEKGYKTDKMSFKDIKEYCSTLKFDENKHEIGSTYVKAWCKRNNVKIW